MMVQMLVRVGLHGDLVCTNSISMSTTLLFETILYVYYFFFLYLIIHEIFNPSCDVYKET